MEVLIDKRLKEHGLRKTIVRRNVLQSFLEAKGTALSSQDLEQSIDHIDRITLYRTVKKFMSAGLIHQAMDGSGVAKYALCGESCENHEHHHNHAHFTCAKCKTTTCIEENFTMKLKLPKGFSLTKSTLVLEGFCANC